ncbi:hypothetical protein KFE25_010723 [Diacronema lutheri]|uniref:WWE domain-containing protein n=1 Tax=Diacronema lutheri TaxID=2081491 RepID=A0A7R9URQ0_DIALT|nr:hypothetical protein KFE25_010723 [Diacronema lutheri]
MARKGSSAKRARASPKRPCASPLRTRTRDDAVGAREVESLREFESLFERLSRCTPTTRVCESTVEGEPSFTVESILPSYFDYYPALKRQVCAVDRREAILLMNDFIRFVETGDKTHLRDPAEMGIGGVIDLTADDGGDTHEHAAESERPGRWQVQLGDSGWCDLDDATNALCEGALRGGRPSFSFVGFQGMRYTMDVARMVQKNEVSGTVRHIRRTTDALFG